MIQIFLVFCQLANADVCKVETPMIDLMTQHECLMLGPVIAAQSQFLKDHPDYHLARYSCMAGEHQKQL